MPRMNILNTVEQEAFESAPVFNSFQRKQYFDFPPGNPAGHREPAYAIRAASTCRATFSATLPLVTRMFLLGQLRSRRRPVGIIRRQNRLPQKNGVRVLRVRKHLTCRSGFNYLTFLHDHHAVADVIRRGQIVSDVNDRHFQLVAERLE